MNPGTPELLLGLCSLIGGPALILLVTLVGTHNLGRNIRAEQRLAARERRRRRDELERVEYLARLELDRQRV